MDPELVNAMTNASMDLLKLEAQKSPRLAKIVSIIQDYMRVKVY